MAPTDRDQLEGTLRLAQQIAAQLEPLVRESTGPDVLALRIAHAHALGLVDLLEDMAGRSIPPDIANTASVVRRALGEDRVRPS